MQYTKEEAQEKWPSVIFRGNCWIEHGAVIKPGTIIKIGARIGAGAVVGAGAIIGPKARIGTEAAVGVGAVVGAGAIIGPKAYIGAEARIGPEAIIGVGAVITPIRSKYSCNISPQKEITLIRIGCETHSIAEWGQMKEELANKHDREWWNESGNRIYKLLKGEAKMYDQKYRKKDVKKSN